jgi:hypothetical protein
MNRLDAAIDVLDTTLWEHQPWEAYIRSAFGAFDTLSTDYIVKLIMSAAPTDSLDEASKLLQQMHEEDPDTFNEIIDHVYDYVNRMQQQEDKRHQTEFGWHRQEAQEEIDEEEEGFDEQGNPLDYFYYIELEFLFYSDEEYTNIKSILTEILAKFPDVRLVGEDTVLEKDDPLDPQPGGVVLYALYPNLPGLKEEIIKQFEGFDYTLDIFPTKGF